METIIVDDFVVGDMSFSNDTDYMIGMGDMTGSTQEVPLGDKLMGSWAFVGGVSAAVLVIGVLFGLLSAKRKIKKGIDLYED